MSKRRASLAERFSGAPTPTPAGEQAFLEELYQIREQEEGEETESKGGLVKRATRRLTRHKQDKGSEDEAPEKGLSRKMSTGRRLSLGGMKFHHKEPDLLEEQVCWRHPAGSSNFLCLIVVIILVVSFQAYLGSL